MRPDPVRVIEQRMDRAARRRAARRADLAARGRRHAAGVGDPRLGALPPQRRHRGRRRSLGHLLRRARVRVRADRPARLAATRPACWPTSTPTPEQQDAEHAIEWIADPAMVHRLGRDDRHLMGGVRGAAARRAAPGAAARVVPIHASDDRYSDDVHYIGGCVSAMDMPQWATSMLAYLNQPPDPAVVGDGWREQWHRRLDDATLFIEPWLGHQRRDDYWRQGSACERYDAIRCPVFAVGGWSDGYRDMVLRVVEHVSAPVARTDRPVGTHRSRARRTRSRDRLPAGVRAVLRRRARRRRQRLLRAAEADQLPAGAGRARRVLRRAAGRWVADPAGRRRPSQSGVRRSGRSGCARPRRGGRRLGAAVPGAAGDRRRRRCLVRRRQPRRLRARPASRRRRLAVLGHAAAGATGRAAWPGARRACGSASTAAGGDRRPRSATSPPTAARRSSPAAC